MTTQDKFMTKMAKLASSYKLDFEHNSEWANTGSFRFTPPDGFAPYVSVRYRFNDGYALLAVVAGSLPPQPLSPNDFTNYRFEQLDEAVRAIDELLA